jgi:hypothetical protein
LTLVWNGFNVADEGNNHSKERSFSMNTTLLDTYRLSAFFAANPTATVKDAQKLKLVKTGGAHFYHNCVHLRDPKGEYPYVLLKPYLSEEEYSTLRTRFTEEQQSKIIEGFNAGESVHQVARKLSLLPHPVTIFSIVYRKVFSRKSFPFGLSKWIPYCRRQFEYLARALQHYDELHRQPPADLQPELIEAIRVFFAVGKTEVEADERDCDDDLFDEQGNLIETPPMDVDEDNDEDEVEVGESELEDDFFDELGKLSDTPPTAMSPPPEDRTTEQQETAVLQQTTIPAAEENNVQSKDALIETILDRLDKIEQTLSPSTPVLPSVEAIFALDVPMPHNIDRWLSKDALALFCKFARGGYLHNRDEDAALLELEEFGLVEIPRLPNRDMMSGVTLLIDRLKVTDKGWSLHRLIRDICEQTIYCCLQDLGSFMGFNLSVKENDR